MHKFAECEKCGWGSFDRSGCGCARNGRFGQCFNPGGGSTECDAFEPLHCKDCLEFEEHGGVAYCSGFRDVVFGKMLTCEAARNDERRCGYLGKAFTKRGED